jgi:hypothetical protein
MTAATGSATNMATNTDANVQLFCGKSKPKRNPLNPASVEAFAMKS